MNVGEIKYTVSVETQQAITASDRIGQSLQGMQGEMENTDRAADNLNAGLSKLAKGIAAVALGAAVKSLAQQVQAYNTMSERVRMATDSMEEFDMVQQRLRETADGTYRRLAEAQEVYIGVSSSLKGMGYSASQAMDVVDSLSYAFVANATSSQRAESAMSALSMATNTGKVRAMQWMSIMKAVPSVVDDIAKATGKTANEVRELGATGEMAAAELVEGLRQSVEKNKEASDSMASDFTDAGVRMNNAIVSVLAVLEKQTGVLKTLTYSIIDVANVITEFSQDTEKMAGFLAVAETAAASLAAVMTAKVLTSMVASGKAFYASTIAVQLKTAADVKAAQAATSAAAAELIKAKQVAAAAVGTREYAFAISQVTLAEGRALAATNALTAAVSAQAGVMTVTQRAAQAMSATYAMLGGPAGLIMLAGVALWQFAKYAGDAKREVADLNEPLENVTERMREMNDIQKNAEMQRWANSMQEAKGQIAAFGAEAQVAARSLLLGSNATGELKTELEAIEAELMTVRTTGHATSESILDLYDRVDALAGVSAKAKDRLRDKLAALDESVAAARRAEDAYIGVAKAAQEVADSADVAAKSVWELADEMRTGSQAAADYASKMGRALEDAADRTHLGRLMRDIRDNAEAWGTATKAQLDAAVASAVAMDAFEKQSRAAKKATGGTKGLTDAQRAAKKAAEDMARAQESNAKALENLQEQLYQAGLNARDLALRQAELTLNEYATDEQRAQVAALADELYRLNDAKRRADKFGDDVGGSIRGSVSPLSGGRFDDQAARYAAEEQAEIERYAAQLQRLREAKELELEVVGGYHALEEQMAQDHALRLQQIDDARRQLALSSVETGFGAVADIMKTAFGEQSAAYKAAFAIQKAAAIAQSVVAIQQGIAMAAANPWPTNLAAMASVAAATAGLVGNIASVTMGGGRQYGGGVSADKYYKVNEGGMPEIFKGSDGNQYLMPNQRGEVVSNKDATRGGGVNVTVNVQQNAQRAGEVDASREQEGIIDIFVADILGDGRSAGAIQGKWGLAPQGI